MLDAHAPTGTPVAAQVAQSLAPVWDAQGDKWSPVEGGYRAETGDPVKAEILARDVGAIPYDYQPTYGYDITVRGTPPDLSDLP
jgi:hypothetical protein